MLLKKKKKSITKKEDLKRIVKAFAERFQPVANALIAQSVMVVGEIDTSS